MHILCIKPCTLPVAPFAGAWIEIVSISRIKITAAVAPFAGAWIEMCPYPFLYLIGLVAPFAGAWIEIADGISGTRRGKSLPSRERGLKL